jgi:hypothetical protein
MADRCLAVSLAARDPCPRWDDDYHIVRRRRVDVETESYFAAQTASGYHGQDSCRGILIMPRSALRREI